MNPEIRSLYESPSDKREEIFPVLTGESFELEHIVSNGEASPPGFWYDQPRDEWVVLIRGEAMLQFKDSDPVPMKAGDSLLIPAHCLHRVESVSGDAHWIALHFDRSPD